MHAACPQAVTALAFTDDGAVLLSGGEDTVVSAWLLMDVLDAGGAQQGGTPTFQAWCAPLLLASTACARCVLGCGACSSGRSASGAATALSGHLPDDAMPGVPSFGSCWASGCARELIAGTAAL